MKCSKCGLENNSDASFCVSCGNKLDKVENLENNDTKNETVQNVQTTTNVANEKKPKNKWLIIGIIILVVVILIGIFGSSDDDYDYESSYNSGSSYQSVDARTQFGNYLTNNAGFTKKSSTKYTKYYDGYTFTVDYSKALFSMENSEIYAVYYYKTDMFGVAYAADGITLASTYNLNTYRYECETDPSTYQTYMCNYMKESTVELAETTKSTFESFATNAGISPYDL